MRIWEVARNMAGGPPTGAAGKAEVDVGAPVLDLEWKDDGMHVFGVGCGKTVKLWNLQTNATQDVGSVSGTVGSHWQQWKGGGSGRRRCWARWSWTVGGVTRSPHHRS